MSMPLFHCKILQHSLLGSITSDKVDILTPYDSITDECQNEMSNIEISLLI